MSSDVDCENGPIDNTLLQFFNGKTILVTGASGYIATNLINSLLPISCTIVRLSRNGNLLPLKGMANIIDVIGNIREINIWQQALENIGFKPQWDIACTIHKCCRAFTCSFVCTESLVGRPYARIRSPSLESVANKGPVRSS